MSQVEMFTQEEISPSYTFADDEFEVHGWWTENGSLIAYMHRHKPTGKMYYDDCPKARNVRVLIHPTRKSP